MNGRIEEIKDSVAEIIQRKRINKGLSTEELSEKVFNNGMKISKNTLERIERGAFSPNADQLYAILCSLNCEVTIDNEKII